MEDSNSSSGGSQQGRLSATHPHFSWVSDKSSYRKTTIHSDLLPHKHAYKLFHTYYFTQKNFIPDEDLRTNFLLTNNFMQNFSIRTFVVTNILHTYFILDEHLHTNFCIRIFSNELYPLRTIAYELWS